MDKMEFVYGSEKRFDEYVLGLKGKKVALVSHTDLDGIASAKVVDEAINPEFLKFVNYGDLNSKLVGELKRAKVNRVIFTDLMLREQSFITDIEKFSEILVIDHHPSENDFNSKKTVFMNSQDNCGAYLSYYLFSKAKKLEKLDWLVACACLADFFYFKNREFMTKTYEKYGDKFEFKGEFVKMDGKFWEFQYDLSLAISYYLGKEMDLYSRLPEKFGELGGLESAVEEVRKDLNNAKKRFDKEKQVIGDNYFWEVESKYPVKSLIVNELSKKIVGEIWLGELEKENMEIGFIFDIHINEDDRNKGYAKKAIIELEKIAKTIGFSKIRLHVFVINEYAIKAYLNSGFNEFNKKDNSIWMEKVI